MGTSVRWNSSLCLDEVAAGPSLARRVASAQAQEASQPPQPILREVRVEGATVFTRDEVTWLLKLREGSPLPKAPADVAQRFRKPTRATAIRKRPSRPRSTKGVSRSPSTKDGSTTSRSSAMTGSNAERLPAAPRHQARRHLQQARHRPRDRAPHGGGAGGDRDRAAAPGPAGSGPRRLRRRTKSCSIGGAGRNVLVVPLRWRTARTGAMFGSGREDLFSPVDALSPAVRLRDDDFRSHALQSHLRQRLRVVQVRPRRCGLFVRRGAADLRGAEAVSGRGSPRHDGQRRPVAPDQRSSRRSSSLAFKNTFRDYYRRRGGQVFAVLRAWGSTTS